MNNNKFTPNSIVVGDVLETLRSIPNDIIDLTVTSPPYNKRNKSHGWLVTNEKYSHFDDHIPEEKYQQLQIAVLDEIFRITKPGGSLFYNHKHRWTNGVLINPFSWLVNTKWTIKQELIWDRVIAANMRGWRFWQIDERIYWLYKPKDNYLIGKELESMHAKFASIWHMRPEHRTNSHPAPFPIELPTRIIYSILTSKNCIVMDPFCGTGTTLVAAKLLGHRYFGIDVSPEYVKHAIERLEKSEDEKNRLQKEKLKHVIEDSFAARKKRGTISWPYGPKLDNDSTKKK